jgi:hypothetical protein
MGFEGKWMQLEDIMLSEVSQDQKHKSHIWKIDPKINIYTKNKHDHYKLGCRTCSQPWNYSMELGKERKEKRMIEQQ